MIVDIKQIKRVRNKIKKNWNLPDDKFENMLEDLYPQISKSLFDDLSILDFIIRYLEIYKSAFESGGIKGENFEYESVFYDKTYEFLKKWLIETKIEVGAQFSFNLLKANYEIKNWILADYQIDFIKNHIIEIENSLNNENYLGEDENPAYHINSIYKNGEKPDVNKYNPQDISITLSLLLYKQYLKEQLRELESINNPIKTFQVHGNLSLQENEDGNLSVAIPLQHIIDQVKKEIKELNINLKPSKQKVDKLLTSKQVCEILQVSLQTLNNWRENGIIIACRIGDKPIRYKIEEVHKAIKELNIQPFTS
ncbi:helix-turn-helix domain-containing protein [Desulfosarcina sp.]|nr:helix-turn-helix domain-containing protein [Desulfosarcina sp.]